MLRYTLVFLLVNIYGRSLGLPVKNSSNGKIVIGGELSELSNECKNEFVLGQIANRLHECNVELPPFHGVNLQCLLFYDANRFMCNRTAIGNEDLATDFATKSTEKQNVSAFCSEAAHFNVPVGIYQKTISSVFKNDVACKKTCVTDDVWAVDTNFYCKYYKWMLQYFNAPQSPQTSTHELNPAVNGASSGSSGPIEGKNDTPSTQVGNQSNAQTKVTETGSTDDKVPSENDDNTNNQPSERAKQESSSVPLSTSIQKQETSKVHTELNSTDKKTPQETVPQNEGNTGDVEKQTNLDGAPVDDANNEAGIDNNPAGNKDPDVAIQQIETPGQKIGLENDDPDDASMDMESDDGKEGNMDTGDDGDDPIGGDIDVKIEPESKITDKRTEAQAILNGDGSQSQREFFQNPDGFTEDDDHFFPFFLTAVIVVAVLYVLYHNKNKVGKMFFGLIVEGRQTGRRRNSRGHAYRRLDTLEQAMNANTEAPPSKIIY